MDKTLYAVANDRNFVNTIPPKQKQSEFFYYKREFGGAILTPIDFFINNIVSFFDEEPLCQREYEMLERFIEYADTDNDDEFSKVLDEALAKVGV